LLLEFCQAMPNVLTVAAPHACTWVGAGNVVAVVKMTDAAVPKVVVTTLPAVTVVTGITWYWYSVLAETVSLAVAELAGRMVVVVGRCAKVLQVTTPVVGATVPVARFTTYPVSANA